MELQPPPAARYKPNNQQVEYSAILPRDPALDQTYSPNPVTYKLQPAVQLKTNPFIVPKTTDHSSRFFQYYNYKPDQTQNSNLNENYSYFNLGTIGTTPPTVIYAPSNQAKVTHAYYHPNPQQPVQYYNEFRPITDASSQYNNPKIKEDIPRYQKPNSEVNKPTPSTRPDEDEKDYSYHKAEDSAEEIEEEKYHQKDDSIKPEFPSPPPFFYKSTNKYENIKNPFADPNFDFDKFISKVRGEEIQSSKQETTEDKFQAIVAQNDSKGKLIHSKIHPIIDLRTPVAFSSPSNKKKVNVKPPLEEDYYYDDEEDEIYDKLKKQQTNSTKPTFPISKPLPISSTTQRIYTHNNKNNPVLTTTDKNKYKSTSNSEKKMPQDDEYEYYDDYDYEEEKYEKPVPMKKPQPVVISTPKSVRVNNKYESVPNISNLSAINKTIQHANHAIASDTRQQHHAVNKSRNESTPKYVKLSEKPKESRTTPTYTTQYKQSSQLPHSTPRITTLKFPKERPRLLTSTVRPNRDRDTTTRNTITKNR